MTRSESYRIMPIKRLSVVFGSVCCNRRIRSMTNAQYIQGVRVVAVRNFFESKCCILCGDIVSPTIDLKISKCDACRCIQVTEECSRSFSARIILKCSDGRRMAVWAHDKHICFITKCEQHEVNEMSLLNTGFFSVHVLQNQIIGVYDYTHWTCNHHCMFIIAIIVHHYYLLSLPSWFFHLPSLPSFPIITIYHCHHVFHHFLPCITAIMVSHVDWLIVDLFEQDILTQIVNKTEDSLRSCMEKNTRFVSMSAWKIWITQYKKSV